MIGIRDPQQDIYQSHLIWKQFGVWLICVNVFRLENLDASTTEARAARILHGLGFTKEMQQKKTRDFSGGWRMRIALARALFVDPSML